MDGRGRALDNVFVERLWRTVKYEEVYLRDDNTVREAQQGLSRYFRFYNSHSAPLGWRSTYFPGGIFPTHSTPQQCYVVIA